jgi:hypothetical protein
MRRGVIIVALVATGCADVCTRAALESTAFQERHAACYARDTLPSPAFDAKACEASMGACTKADQQALQAYFDCLEKLPVCAEATKSAFNAEVLECAKGVTGLSAGCFRP